MYVKLKIKSVFISVLLFILITLVLIGLLYYPMTMGLADNSDFARTINNFDIHSDENQKYFSFQDRYIINEPKSISAYAINIFKPLKYSPEKYYSSQYIFVKCSLLINSIYNKLTDTDRHSYYLGFQTILYILFYALAITFFLRKKWLSSIIGDILLKACFLIIFLDSGYLVYFNSFFGETTTLIFLLLSFVLLLILEKGQANSTFIYCLLIAAIWIFSGSKSANFPSAVLLSIPLIYSIIKLKGKKKKIILMILLSLSLYSAYGYVKKVPEIINKVTTYQATFFGVLKDNPETETALQDLDLDEELLQLETTHGYLPIPYDKYSEEFDALFYQHISKLDILKYYLTHPKYCLKKLDISAEAALPLRPTYLSNISNTTGKADLTFSYKLNAWENLRKSFSNNALLIVIGLLALSFINVIVLFKRNKNYYQIILRISLIGSAIGQFIVPIVSNGEADLMKHMFLFNVNLDLLIILLIYDNIKLFIKHYKISLPIFLVLLILIVHPISISPKTITFGNIDGKPIEWYITQEKSQYLKVISKDALFYNEFDDSMNFYEGSEIYNELTQKKSEWFTKEEQKLIVKQTYPLILNYNKVNEAVKGDRPLYWFSGMKYAKQDSDRAYQTEYEGYLTLPSLSDITQLYNISKESAVLNKAYWLRTPYYSSVNLTRAVYPDYQIYHKRVTNELGIRPIMWIRKK